MKLYFVVLLACLHGSWSHVVKLNGANNEESVYMESNYRAVNADTPNSLTDTYHIRRSAADLTNSTSEVKSKRAFLFVAKFLGQIFAKFAINAGIQALKEHLFKKEDPIEKLQASIDQLTESVEKLQEDVKRIGKNILGLEIGNRINSFATTIYNYHLLMSQEMDILVKEQLNDHEQYKQKEVVDQILQGGRLKMALRNLHLSIIGKNNYPNKHIIEVFNDMVLSGRGSNPFTADSRLRSDIMLFLKFLLETQAVGFNVLYTATDAKYRNDPGRLEYIRKDVENTERERLEEQKQYLAEKIFKPCKDLHLPDYPKRPKSLSCSDGFDFGSVCHQRCAGSCLEQRRYSDKYWYPSYGFPDVQCLLKGVWSKNVKDQTLLHCTFCADDSPVSTPALPYHCMKTDRRGKALKCSATKKINVGLKSGRKCQNACHALGKVGSKAWKTWCYVDGKDWEYCLPEKFLRKPVETQNQLSVKGKKCKSKCIARKWPNQNYYWCYEPDGDWDYCS